MATGTSSGHYTPENENFCRYFRLVNETGVKPLRKILENEASSRTVTVEAFLGSHKKTMQILKQRGIIQKHQFDMIYPQSGNFQFKKMDISILCCIIKNTCVIPARGRVAADSLRQSRNDICHNPGTTLSRLDYDTKFSNIKNSIEILLKECQDPNFETDIKDEIKNIEESPVSVASILKLFKEFLVVQNSVQASNIDDKLVQLDEKVSLVYTTQGELKDLYAKVEKQPNVGKLLHSDAQTGINPMIETILQQTESVLNEKPNFVLTKQFEEIENKLLYSGSVIICGGAGEGKTLTAYEIMRRNRHGNNCIQISCPDDVRFLDPRLFGFVFIDDIFGIHEVDESKLQSWIHMLEKLQQLVNARAFSLIISTRDILFKECKKSVEKFSIFSNTMSLSSKSLSHIEKHAILSSALTSKNRQCSDEIIRQCVSTFSSDLGFPYTCILFASDDSFFQEGISFFKLNPFLNYSIFQQLNGAKQMALLFLWIKDGTVPVALNRSEENDVLLQKLSNIVKYNKKIDEIYDDVSTQCKLMDGVFVTKRPDKKYQFAHNTVYQSIGYYFARKGLYTLVIKYSNLAFFMECVAVTEGHYRSDCVYLRKEYYEQLVERIISEVIDKCHYCEMAMHPCLTQTILERLITTLKRRRKLKEFFLSGVSEKNETSDPSSYNSFLAFYLESCATETCWFLNQVHNNLKCSVHISSKKQCKICKMYLQAYHGACSGGNIDALKVLNFVKCDKSMLLDAAYSGNVLMYEYVINLIDPKEVTKYEHKALCIAVEKQNVDMYTVIRKYGCMPKSECLLLASKARNSAFLVHILKDMHVSDALINDINVKYIKSTLFSIDVFNAFVLVGMCPTKEDIVRSMASDKKATESILWDLKYMNKEETRNTNVQVSNVWTELTEDEDLKEKLKECGVLETSIFLHQNIQRGDKKAVDTVIKHLKRKEDWNPSSKFAVGLLNSCQPSNIDMFEFLLESDIIPNYTTLYYSVSTNNVEIVKLTLTKMKLAGNFDSTHTCSKRALLQSVLCCDIYNVLIDEGMKPKAYHFLYAVECDIDPASRLKVISNLYAAVDKHNCLNCLDKNVMVLAILGSFENSELYNCLQKSAFQLSPDTLPVIACRGDTLQMERFIEVLKDQNDWPPPCPSLQKALHCSFYIPDVFEIQMNEIDKEYLQYSSDIAKFFILFACRKQAFSEVETHVSELKKQNSWNPTDIVLKCSLLESSDDTAASDIFTQNGVVTYDILDDAHETGNIELQSYLTAYLTKKGQDVISFKTLNEDTIKSLSAYPALCCEQLLNRAVEVSDVETVTTIIKTITEANSEFLKSYSQTSCILDKCSNRLDMFEHLLNYGFIPTMDCLLNIVKRGSFELYQKTMELLYDTDRFFVTHESSRELVHESLKRREQGFYTILSKYGMKPRVEDLLFAIEMDNMDICHALITDVEDELEHKWAEITDAIIMKGFHLYSFLRNKGLPLPSSTLLKVTNSFIQKQADISNVKTVCQDFFSCQSWSFEDENLIEMLRLSENNEQLMSVLHVYLNPVLEKNLLNALMSRNSECLKNVLNEETYDIKNVLPQVLRQAVISRKRLDKCCTHIIFEWIEKTNCGPSLKILSSVLKLDTEGMLKVIYKLSQVDKSRLDKRCLETALEEAIFMNKTGMYCYILRECCLKPTTYCLLYSLCHNDDDCFQITLRSLPAMKKTCRDPYYKSALSLCCKRSDIERFSILLNESKHCDTELLFEAVISKNEAIVQKVKEILMKTNRWDFNLKDYWTSSALCEASGNPQMESILESYYDDTFINDYEIPDSEQPNQVDNDEENAYAIYVRHESEYEELDDILLYDTAC